MSDIFFSCTAFFGFNFEDKFERACNALQSVVDQHKDAEPESLQRIGYWVLINEYSDKDTDEQRQTWSEGIRKRFPFITFINKTAEQKGQANSLNMILDMLRQLQTKYWIHWEEAWYATRPFLREALSIMAEEPKVTQLQLTHENGNTNFLDAPISEDRRDCRSTWCTVAPPRALSPEQETLFDDPYEYQGWWIVHWPMYSLRPSVNRTSHYAFAFQDGGGFRTEPDLWPCRFEWEFSRRWQHAGSVKAVIKAAPVTRIPGHVSTYSRPQTLAEVVVVPPAASPSSPSSSLSGGAIAGIVIGVVVAVLAIVLGLVFGLKAKNDQRRV